MDMMRLDVCLRTRGAASKKEAREWCAAGRVLVNGVPVFDASNRISPDDGICIDGEPVLPRNPVILMMNKPTGYVCTDTNSGLPSVFSLLKEKDRLAKVFAVGRLDADTSGLLILTNSGDLCSRLLRPERHVPKLYVAELDRELPPTAEQRAEEGIKEKGGIRFAPCKIERLGRCRCLVTVTEGKYHEVRRILRACGAQTTALKRVRLGGLWLGDDLHPGEYRGLSPMELKALFNEK